MQYFPRSSSVGCHLSRLLLLLLQPILSRLAFRSVQGGHLDRRPSVPIPDFSRRLITLCESSLGQRERRMCWSAVSMGMVATRLRWQA